MTKRKLLIMLEYDEEFFGVHPEEASRARWPRWLDQEIGV